MANDDREAIETLIGKMGELWRAGRIDALAEYFDENMVLAAPGQSARPIEGRDECLETYRDFLAGVRVTDYAIEDPWIAVWGATGVAVLPWMITWEDEDGVHGASGQDVFTLTKRDCGWRVVGRMLLEQTRAGAARAM